MKHWTAQEAALAKKLVDRRASDEECLATVGRNYHACYMKAYRWKERAHVTFRKPHCEPAIKAPPHVIEEAMRRLSAPRSLTAWIFGDPAPGQSALERRA